MKIYSGSSNPSLSKKIARHLKVRLGKVELSTFANGECRLLVKDKPGQKAAAVQSLAVKPDRYLVETGLLADALKRTGADKIIGVIPYLGYSKQDKVFREGEPLSSKIIVKMLQAADIDKFVVIDLHNQALVGFFEKPVIQLSALPLFLDYFKKIKDNRSIVVAPDAGAVKSSTQFADQLGLDVAYINKSRDLKTGKVSIKDINKDIQGKKVIIIDDMISTGSTIIESAKFLKKQGAKQVLIGVTHHLYITGVQEAIEKSQIDKLIVTDTVQPPARMKKYKKLKTISVAKLIAQALKKNNRG